MALHDAAVSAGLAGSRNGLLSGINTAFVATLPIARTPSEQLLCDLHALSEAGRLVDGAIPLLLWISNAITLSASRKESLTFGQVRSYCEEVICPDSAGSPGATIASGVAGDDARAPPGGLHVSDVQIIPNRASRTRTLDFRVWNGGHAPVLINRIWLEVLDVQEVHSLGYMEFSQEYDLDISSLSMVGDRIGCNVSQRVDPGGVDRFGIRLIAARLGTGVFRFWRLRLSLATNLGSTDGPVVELSLPCESEEEHRWAEEARRASELAQEAKRRWRTAIPSCLIQYLDEMQRSNMDLSPVRDTLEGAYPSRDARILVLFEWLGSSHGPWNAAPNHESVPELLLLEYPTSVLVTCLSAHVLTSAHTQGATRYFAGWRFSQWKRSDLAEIPHDLRQVFLAHSLTANYDEGKLFKVQRAFGQLPPRDTAQQAAAPDGAPSLALLGRAHRG